MSERVNEGLSPHERCCTNAAGKMAGFGLSGMPRPKRSGSNGVCSLDDSMQADEVRMGPWGHLPR